MCLSATDDHLCTVPCVGCCGSIRTQSTSSPLPSPPLPSPPLLSVQIQRYNVLLKTIRSSLADLEKGIKGLVVMSADLEEVFTCIYNAQVPALWSKVLHRRPCGVQLTCM